MIYEVWGYIHDSWTFLCLSTIAADTETLEQSMNVWRNINIHDSCTLCVFPSQQQRLLKNQWTYEVQGNVQFLIPPLCLYHNRKDY